MLSSISAKFSASLVTVILLGVVVGGLGFGGFDVICVSNSSEIPN